MRRIVSVISVGIALIVASSQESKAVIPVLVDGAPTLEALETTSITNDLLHYVEVAADWIESLNNQLESINQFAFYLELFGNPANIVNMVGLDSVVGGGGVLGSITSLGGELFNSYDQVQSLASRGMDLYQVAGGIAGGDWQTALRTVGLSNVVPLAQAGAVFDAQGTSLTGARSYLAQAQSAMVGMRGSAMQAKRAKTDAEIGKATASQAAQIATAQQAMDQAFLDQQIVANQFSSQGAMQTYLANAERNARVRADNGAGFFAPAGDAQLPNMDGALLSSAGPEGIGGPDGGGGVANGLLSNSIASRVGESTAGVPGTESGNKACAWVVNSVFARATGSSIATGGDRLSVLGTVAAMEAQPGRFREVSLAEAMSSGRDYVIASNPAWGSSGSHIGIGNGSAIWSNSSSQAAIAQNYTSGSWSGYYGTARYFIAL